MLIDTIMLECPWMFLDVNAPPLVGLVQVSSQKISPISESAPSRVMKLATSLAFALRERCEKANKQLAASNLSPMRLTVLL